jgi:hypothetical protein
MKFRVVQPLDAGRARRTASNFPIEIIAEWSAAGKYAGRELPVLARPGTRRSQEKYAERNSIPLSRFVRTRHAMTPSSQCAIHRVAAVQERQHRSAPHANPLESAADAEIASRRHQPFLERTDRFTRASRLLIHLGQIQIKLRVVYFHSQRFAAESFAVAVSPFGESCEQPGVGKIKRILWRNTQGASGVKQSFVGIPVAQMLEAFLEIAHSRI